jgi:aminopeptidase N
MSALKIVYLKTLGYKMKILNYFCFSLLISVVACKNNKQVTQQKNIPSEIVTEMPKAEEVSKPFVYRESRERKTDLLHMKLWISFNYQKQQANAQAILKFKPYFYPQNSLDIDARGFEIKELGLVSAKNTNAKKAEVPLKYTYDNEVIKVNLDKLYNAKDTFYLFIDYVAKPNELKEGGSNAITSDKGLYFINPIGTEPNKPRQIWTQGETQSSSAWFPTIDSPNEKITQELFITVDKKDVTLSNGLLIFSNDNGDGTRTDYWKMDQPHAPYLVMMAIGEFSIVKDKWRDLAVNYFIEKEYEPYAKEIFGNTPEMMECFSKLLGVDYPWPKYHQVVVRDYVSGAMENTSATLHGEFLNKTHREMIDGNQEDIVAHELFHQWFGDLVTCESWSNLPLNESFATYGEYLWEEYKYGRDAADRHNHQGLNTYLSESRQKQVNMIRFNWESREDMFDSHSYAKGGRILHMLRKTVGDEAFFKSLSLYLNKNKFKSAEIHDLRLAFEEVTGQDLNWFFNQWFLASGHPKLKITHQYIDSTKTYSVTLKQNQNFENTPLYRLPMDVDIYEGGKVNRERIVLTDKEQTFNFKVTAKPDLVNVDAEKMLLAVKEEKKSKDELVFQYKNAPLFLDRLEALEAMSKQSSSPEAQDVILTAINDKYWAISKQAIDFTSKFPSDKKAQVKPLLLNVLNTNLKSSLREEAIYKLADDHASADLADLFIDKLFKDSSYAVQSACLYGLKKVDQVKAMQACKTLENDKNSDIVLTIADIYKDAGTAEQNEYFVKSFKNLNGFSRYSLIQVYSMYLNRMNDDVVNKGVPLIEETARNEKTWWIRLSGIQALNGLVGNYERKEADLKSKIEVAEGNKETALVFKLKEELKTTEDQRKKIDLIVSDIKKNEKDPNLTRFWDK